MVAIAHICPDTYPPARIFIAPLHVSEQAYVSRKYVSKHVSRISISPLYIDIYILNIYNYVYVKKKKKKRRYIAI